jgi:hypothetical protein
LRLAALVGDGSLKPQLVEGSWRELTGLAGAVRDPQIAGKAVFRVDDR